MNEYTLYCPVCGGMAEITDSEVWYVEKEKYFGYDVLCSACHTKSRVELCQFVPQTLETVNALLDSIDKCGQESCGDCTYNGGSDCVCRLLRAASVHLLDYKYFLEHKQNVDS